MDDEPLMQRRVIVDGHVQGVGYRAFARRMALRLSIKGWVRNRRDGAVEALVAGAPRNVEAMIVELRRGPYGATVLDMRIDDASQEEAGVEFKVLGTL